jgi:hypothetical protein
MGFTKHATDLFISRKIADVVAVGATDVSSEFQSSAAWVALIRFRGQVAERRTYLGMGAPFNHRVS